VLLNVCSCQLEWYLETDNTMAVMVRLHIDRSLRNWMGLYGIVDI